MAGPENKQSLETGFLTFIDKAYGCEHRQAVLDRFIRSSDRLIKDLDESIERGDASEIRALLGRMKSLATSIYAGDLSGSAWVLEQAAARGIPDPNKKN
ncbi:MAG: Hpt domain-containing protein [Cyanobacteria bacterium HKST-UBA02]|nr:Hpt domain-containing protein [Cyanobacteria bacterium HKST-UBA02]